MAKEFSCSFYLFWLGAVFSVIIMFIVTPTHESDKSIIISNSELMKKIDNFIIIPFSGLSYFSGLLISWKSNWGFLNANGFFVNLLFQQYLSYLAFFFLLPGFIEVDI